MKFFQFAVALHPTESDRKAGLTSTVLVEVTTVLAKDAAQATLIAARAIPTLALDKLDRVEVAVRPF